MIKLLSQNSKMRDTSKITGNMVYNFTLPAIKTCPSAGECKNWCYASSGTFRFGNVQKKHEANFKATRNKLFTQWISDELLFLLKKGEKANKNIFVRIHDSGDFYSKEYLFKWISIISNFSSITFYCYTKRVKLMKKNSYLLPENFIVNFSFGGTEDELININEDRHVKIFKDEESYDKSYSFSGENDLIAASVNNNRIGLIIHGQKSKNFLDT